MGENVICALLGVMLFFSGGGWGRRRELLMFAAFCVMVCYRVGEMKGNFEVFSITLCFYSVGKKERNCDVC